LWRCGAEGSGRKGLDWEALLYAPDRREDGAPGGEGA
jgi:hypothetical protein